MRCKYCENFSIASIRGENYRHQPGLEALWHSTLRGCPLCAIIYRSLFQDKSIACPPRVHAGENERATSNTQVWIDDYTETQRSHRQKNRIGTDQFDKIGTRYEVNTNREVETFSGKVDVITEVDNPAAPFIEGRVVSSNPASVETWHKIYDWIEECAINHKCYQRAHPFQRLSGIIQRLVWRQKALTRRLEMPLRWMPTRLINVGPSNGSQEPFLQTEFAKIESYIALSYCWGHSQQVTTTRENVEAYKRKISYKSLPQTIQHAISATRKLEVRYLWVDALCIVQDNGEGEDWQAESARMADIYGNAFLTIEAALAADSNEGFLCLRENPHRWNIKPCRISYCKEDGKLCGSILLGFSIGQRRAPLFDRGWAFHERKLSRRVLTFHRNYVSFTCKQGTAREDSVLPLGFTLTQNVYQGNSPFRSLTNQSREECLYIWYECIEKYSVRLLTFPRDKLPAISGCAHKFHERIGGAYYAGLWGNEMALGLLWRRTESQSPLLKPQEPRAPSWSWAALDGPIEYDSNILFLYNIRTLSIFHLKVEECTVAVSSLDLMGHAPRGTLKISGHMRKARWLNTPGTTFYDQRGFVKMGLDVLSLQAERFANDKCKGCAKIKRQYKAQAGISHEPFIMCQFDTHQPEQSENIWCMFVAQIIPNEPRDKLNTWTHKGLILQVMATQTEYCRIGVFEVENPAWFLECHTSTIVIV